MKNTLEFSQNSKIQESMMRFNSTEEWTSILENQVVEITQLNRENRKKDINLG